ncbi:MAG: methyltransferase domain-containing protein [Clostridia bacterium]|nr:methyltransferase domain-containing protein [Clostridia bacterium]
MNSYTNFAKYYDILMHKDISYSKICDFIENIFILKDLNPNLICDLACGTGNVSIPLAKRGYELISVDKSIDMLNIAREKAQKDNLDILFLNQSITRLDLFGTCDAFLCMIDGINYILNPSSLIYAFKRIKDCFLNPGGILIFDISSYYKLSSVIGNNTFIHDTDEIFYAWENRFLNNKQLSDMYLNFFIKKKNGYSRFCERHLQRAYTSDEIKIALKKAGFTDIDTYNGFSFTDVNEKTERIVFCAR